MQKWLPATLPVVIGATWGGQAVAAGIDVKVGIPRLNVAEYHRPYVAIWLEHPDQSIATHLAVWYQQSDGPEGKGTKWLKDLRQWWRKGGRELNLPVDGVSGATRPAGEHSLSFTEGKAPFTKLPAGEYRLVVEAAREVGGRELVRVPFSWPPKAAQSLKAEGKEELGTVTLQIKP